MAVKRKQPERVVPVSTPMSIMMIDLLEPLLLTHGVSINGRPRPDTLAGVADGLSEAKIFFGEIFAEDDLLCLKFWEASRFYHDQEPDIAEKIESLNTKPECLTNGERWLRIGTTSEKYEGSGKNVFLVAKITVAGGDILADDCDEKIRFVVALIRDSWPIK